MQVVLKQDVKDLGKKGQLVNVSDGYGKNYLIPRKIAVPADASALNELKNREAAEAHRLAVEKATAVEAAEKINGKTKDCACHYFDSDYDETNIPAVSTLSKKNRKSFIRC
mgnify:CR=1 FL=1